MRTAAARIHALGYEAGMWEFMGSVNIARLALDAISVMPGMD
jgi:hypothetical protein